MTEELEHRASDHHHQPPSNYRRSRTLASSRRSAIITDRADKGKFFVYFLKLHQVSRTGVHTGED